MDVQMQSVKSYTRPSAPAGKNKNPVTGVKSAKSCTQLLHTRQAGPKKAKQTPKLPRKNSHSSGQRQGVQKRVSSPHSKLLQHNSRAQALFRAASAPVPQQHSGRNNKTSATAPNTRPTISRPTGHPDGHPDATRLLDTKSVAYPRGPTEALANTNLGLGPTKTKKSINIASLNICGGLYSKEELICQLAQEKSLHVLALCETELQHMCEKLPFTLSGYKTLFPSKNTAILELS